MVRAGDGKLVWPLSSVTNVQGSPPINAQNATRVTPLLSHTPCHVPASSSVQSVMSLGCSLDPVGQPLLGMENSPFTLRPVPYFQDHARPITVTNIIPLRLLNDAGNNTSAASASTDIAPQNDNNPKLDIGCYPQNATQRVRFLEGSAPITHQEDEAVTGRRSADMDTALDTRFADIDRYFIELSVSTTLPINQLINLYLKSRGRSVYSGLPRLTLGTATAEVKQGTALESRPPPFHDSSSAPKPLPQTTVRMPNPNMRVKVVPPPSRAFKVARPLSPSSRPFKVLPTPPATQSDVIDITSTEESDPEYEEAGQGKKRKVKSANRSRVLKKIATSTQKATVTKVWMIDGRCKDHTQSRSPPHHLPTSNTSAMKGGPLSPFTVGSSTDGSPSPEHGNAGKAMYLRDSDQSQKECVQTRPLTKDSPVRINRGLHMVYGKSDWESDVDACMKAGFATTMGAIPEGSGSANIQSDLGDGSAQLVMDEVVGDMKETLPPPASLNVVAPIIPNRQHPRDSDIPRPRTPHDTQDEHLHDAPRSDLPHYTPCTSPRDGHDPPREPLHKPLHDPHDSREPPRNSPNPAYNYWEAMHHRDEGLGNYCPAESCCPYTRGYSQEPMGGLDHSTLRPRDAFYNRNSRNVCYVLPQYPYESSCMRAQGDLNTHGGSPASDVHDDHSPGERKRAYLTRCSPEIDLGYAGEGGYMPWRVSGHRLHPSHSHSVGGGNYRMGGYPQGHSRRLHDSRRADGAHWDYGRDAIPRAFRAVSHSLPNPPRPPPVA
ncbi:hypothetical protein P692DRAFT_20880460 [Suillus brevipes Sb2]|nr:hypothetical protein P692DRAFT_20880460 [Suillus brevipes Sb2]